jgi:sortase A
MRNRSHLFAERLLLAAGLALLAVVAVALIHRCLFSHLALVEFDELQATRSQKESKPGVGAPGGEVADLSLWSKTRIREYRKSLFTRKDPPLAILRIDRLRIRVPVFEGTGGLVLNSGVGWISGTARPGEVGNVNIGIAGHRDGFFRGFKDIAVGDAIELSAPGVVSNYQVDGIKIVSPYNVGVLQDRGGPSLTLVTCYPFHFLGDAPQRFIVNATLKRQVGVKLQEKGSASANQAIRY